MLAYVPSKVHFLVRHWGGREGGGGGEPLLASAQHILPTQPSEQLTIVLFVARLEEPCVSGEKQASDPSMSRSL